MQIIDRSVENAIIVQMEDKSKSKGVVVPLGKDLTKSIEIRLFRLV
jgi:hypothetical protein